MLELLERKIRLRARQLYEERGRVEGRELEDWVRAESEVLKSSILAPLWNARLEVQLMQDGQQMQEGQLMQDQQLLEV
jgi:hypothetical protein